MKDSFMSWRGPTGDIKIALNTDGTISCSGTIYNGDDDSGELPSIPAPVVPANAGAPGVAGTMVWDTGFVYVCVGTNTWKRAALTTW